MPSNSPTLCHAARLKLVHVRRRSTELSGFTWVAGGVALIHSVLFVGPGDRVDEGSPVLISGAESSEEGATAQEAFMIG